MSILTPRASRLSCPAFDLMDLDGLSPAEAGEVDLYLLDPAWDPALEECLSSPCACYCVLKRPGGCLLVVPQAAVSEPALAAADESGHVGLVGPSLATSCKAISLTESGIGLRYIPPSRCWSGSWTSRPRCASASRLWQGPP